MFRLATRPRLSLRHCAAGNVTRAMVSTAANSSPAITNSPTPAYGAALASAILAGFILQGFSDNVGDQPVGQYYLSSCNVYEAGSPLKEHYLAEKLYRGYIHAHLAALGAFAIMASHRRAVGVLGAGLTLYRLTSAAVDERRFWESFDASKSSNPQALKALFLDRAAHLSPAFLGGLSSVVTSAAVNAACDAASGTVKVIASPKTGFSFSLLTRQSNETRSFVVRQMPAGGEVALFGNEAYLDSLCAYLLPTLHGAGYQLGMLAAARDFVFLSAVVAPMGAFAALTLSTAGLLAAGRWGSR